MRTFLNLLLVVPAVLAAAIIDKRQTSTSVEGAWIVRVRDNSPLSLVLNAVSLVTGVRPEQQYSFGSFRGFAFNGDDRLVDLIAKIPSIVSIERDNAVSISAPVEKRALTTQIPAECGLSRISRRARGGVNYVYDTTAGSGTTVYIIDTGVNIDHDEFSGRASHGGNFISAESDGDFNGHGTHCAGTAAGTTYGVAKLANIIGVKVLNSQGGGFSSGLIAGIDWSVNNARQNNRLGQSVISMSLAGGFSRSMNDAVAAAVRAGVFTVAAAGNANTDANRTSPASEPTAFTVGATDRSDNRASFSNFGPSLDIFAPGVGIVSASHNSKNGTRSLSGTSMACPHVAGLAAYIIGLEGQRSPAALATRLTSLATKDVVKNAGAGSPNNLAYNGSGL